MRRFTLHILPLMLILILAGCTSLIPSRERTSDTLPLQGSPLPPTPTRFISQIQAEPEGWNITLLLPTPCHTINLTQKGDIAILTIIPPRAGVFCAQIIKEENILLPRAVRILRISSEKERYEIDLLSDHPLKSTGRETSDAGGVES